MAAAGFSFDLSGLQPKDSLSVRCRRKWNGDGTSR